MQCVASASRSLIPPLAAPCLRPPNHRTSKHCYAIAVSPAPSVPLCPSRPLRCRQVTTTATATAGSAADTATATARVPPPRGLLIPAGDADAGAAEQVQVTTISPSSCVCVYVCMCAAASPGPVRAPRAAFCGGASASAALLICVGGQQPMAPMA